jgi:COP9 signalosome complex subunit 4
MAVHKRPRCPFGNPESCDPDACLSPLSIDRMDQKLAEYASLNQRDKAPAYLSLLSEILARPDQTAIPADLHRLVDTVVNEESVGLVASRQVLTELVKALSEGKVVDAELRKQIVVDTLGIVQPRQNSYDEQVSARVLRSQCLSN